MIIRVRAPEGMHRIEVGLEDTLARLLEKLAPTMNAPAPDSILLSRDAGRHELLAEFERSLVSLGLKHGDMLFATVAPSARPSVEPTGAGAAGSGGAGAGAGAGANGGRAEFVMQEPVDNLLEKDSGLIKRERDARMCKHGGNAMCEYCMPIEPFDKGYLEERKVKHMSFQAYLRQILANHKVRGDISGGIPPNIPLPLEDPDYRVRPNCRGGHAPWPGGICSKCQPSAITLQRQPFRMVDNVEFASPDIVDRLLAFWRTTRCQRLGLLYGRYDVSPDVPLGVKAVVEAIYEPAQSWELDGIKVALGSDEFAREVARADAGAEACGLQMVGMIFTDLTPAAEPGKVLYRRHADSYFLTSLECRLAAYMQLQRPNASRWARDGRFGSKFVTCCVSGNQDGDVDISAWQLSNSAMAMLAADLIVPSSEPSKMCVEESTSTRYVPDVFYRYTNEYNLAVTANAKPAFPVEYLLVNLTHGFPLVASTAFSSDSPFVIENRDHVHQPQTLGALKRHIESANGSPARLAMLLADFHLLVYLLGLDIMGPDEIQLAARVVREPAAATQAAQELMGSTGWQTLTLMLREASDSDLGGGGEAGQHHSAPAVPRTGSPPPGQADAGNGAAGSSWACRHCTFENDARVSSCDMCALPRD
ncbi:nuclear protein localization protein 4 [Coemansia biformis]|uniref:Nuclear protein localization protein 4 n=1 Tax=Coemansia biformis TaxID=1286918 RepID=A0A9W7YIN4_9FUNG|nr:nuclear protein localization protein 4 [Coemansia biformis]